MITGSSPSWTTSPSTLTRRCAPVVVRPWTKAPTSYAARPSTDLTLLAFATAAADGPACTTLTVTCPSSSTSRSRSPGLPVAARRAACVGSRGMSSPRARSLPVPIGTRATSVSRRPRSWSTWTTRWTDPSPPQTTSRRSPQERTASVTCSTLEVLTSSTGPAARSSARTASTVALSASSVPVPTRAR